MARTADRSAGSSANRIQLPVGPFSIMSAADTAGAVRVAIQLADDPAGVVLADSDPVQAKHIDDASAHVPLGNAAGSWRRR